MRRREFIQNSAFAVAGIMAIPSFIYASRVNSRIGLQLYTLRDSIVSDPRGVLKAIASAGYQELETYSYNDGHIFGMSYRDFASYVKDLGMSIVSGHYPLEMLEGPGSEKLFEDAKAVGQTYIVVPGIEENRRKTLDGYKSVCESLNKAGESAKKYGLRVGYHNHAFEFDKIDGEIPFDLMLQELDSKYVSLEMDIYWVHRAGYNALDYFKKFPGRFEQWHVKDMARDNKDNNADIGTGTIDFKAIFTQAEQSGMKHFYIEQETYPVNPMASIEAGIRNLKRML